MLSSRLLVASLIAISAMSVMSASAKGSLSVMCSMNFQKDDPTCSGEGLSNCLSGITCMGAGATGQGSQQIVCDDDLNGFTVSNWDSDPKHECKSKPTRQLHVPLNNTCFKAPNGYYARAFCSPVQTAAAEAPAVRANATSRKAFFPFA